MKKVNLIENKLLNVKKHLLQKQKFCGKKCIQNHKTYHLSLDKAKKIKISEHEMSIKK